MHICHYRYIFSVLIALCSTIASASNDPLGTQDALPLKPSLRLNEAQGDPCQDISPKHALNLFDSVNLALCNNPQTREIWASARVQAAQVGINRAAYLPSLTLNAGLSRNWPVNGNAYNQRNAGLSLSYLIYDFGARAANLESAKQLLAAAGYTQDSTVQAIFLAVVQAYFQSQATLAAVDSAKLAETAAQASFAAANARYLAGSATPTDKYSAQTAYSQAKLNHITAEGAHQNVQGTLANLLGLEAGYPVTLIAEHGQDVPDNFEQDVHALIEQARKQRPDLQAAAAQLQAAQAITDAARAAGRPSISLGATTGYQGISGSPWGHSSTLGVNLSVPIFSGYAPTYRIRSAEAQAEVKQAQLDKLRLQVALDVWTAYQNLTTATQALHATFDLVHSATQSEQMTLGRYHAGVGLMLDVLNAQSSLASARLQNIQARLNWNISRATLAQAMGNLDGDLIQRLSDETPIAVTEITPVKAP